MGAEQILQSAHRPLTSEEIVARVNDKNRRSVYSELRTLRKHKLLVRIEIRLAISETQISNPVVLYRWVG